MSEDTRLFDLICDYFGLEPDQRDELRDHWVRYYSNDTDFVAPTGDILYRAFAEVLSQHSRLSQDGFMAEQLRIVDGTVSVVELEPPHKISIFSVNVTDPLAANHIFATVRYVRRFGSSFWLQTLCLPSGITIPKHHGSRKTALISARADVRAHELNLALPVQLGLSRAVCALAFEQTQSEEKN